MGRGLSNIQKVIIEELKNNDGIHWSYLISAAKIKCYPNLWAKSNYSPYAYCKRHGYDQEEKNRARVIISRSISRLIDRGLIRIEKRNYYYNG